MWEKPGNGKTHCNAETNTLSDLSVEVAGNCVFLVGSSPAGAAKASSVGLTLPCPHHCEKSLLGKDLVLIASEESLVLRLLFYYV